ncbi:hypothetical protein [Methanolapillus africanus]|uniref:hypothetical protein n=1 Tax=Methanolapillus africanus TaxID=3028297 RepID=UPI0030B8B6AC
MSKTNGGRKDSSKLKTEKREKPALLNPPNCIYFLRVIAAYHMANNYFDNQRQKGKKESNCQKSGDEIQNQTDASQRISHFAVDDDTDCQNKKSA